MSPLTLSTWNDFDSFPRVSGDEPVGLGGVSGEVRFSPRERG